MASRTENAFEVLSRDEAAPEVEKPAVQVTQEDVEKGTARAEAKGAVLAPTGSPSPPAAVRIAGGVRGGMKPAHYGLGGNPPLPSKVLRRCQFIKPVAILPDFNGTYSLAPLCCLQLADAPPTPGRTGGKEPMQAAPQGKLLLSQPARRAALPAFPHACS